MARQRLWDRLAAGYDRRAQRDAGLADAVALARPHLAGDAVLLDLACGTGAAGLRMASHVARVDGIDTAPKMIAIAERHAAERRATNMRFWCTDVFDERLEPASYDAVFVFNILHLLPDPAQTLHRVRTLLRPGGLVAILTPCAADAGPGARSFVRVVRALRILPGLQSLSRHQVVAMVEGAGFRILHDDVVEDDVPTSRLLARSG